MSGTGTLDLARAAAPTVTLFDLPVRAETLEEAVARIDASIRSGRPAIHVVLNAAKVSKLARDADFRASLAQFDMIHADGASVVWASRLLGRALPERVAGIDLMVELVRLAAERGFRPYFLGARPDVVERCVRVLRERHPALEVAGWRHGYWDPTEEAEVVRGVRDSRADMLFLGMPTPRKECFVLRQRHALGVPFAMGVGGSFDVVAGLVARAPVAWQRAGMEWAYRLLLEPRRMWRRYLVTNTHFVWIVGRELVRRWWGRAGR
jgi:N-acetylglucosaminyldiphosphoundecaprenol N-acetyl-beta-D-mannosaminyltransferase